MLSVINTQAHKQITKRHWEPFGGDTCLLLWLKCMHKSKLIKLYPLNKCGVFWYINYASTKLPKKKNKGSIWDETRECSFVIQGPRSQNWWLLPGEAGGPATPAWGWTWQHAWGWAVWMCLRSRLKPINVKINIPCQLLLHQLPLLNFE